MAHELGDDVAGDASQRQGIEEERLDVLGHQAALLGRPVAGPEPVEVDVTAGLGEADVALVRPQALGRHRVDGVKRRLCAAGVGDRVTKEALEVKLVLAEQLAKHVVDAVTEVVAHDREFFSQATKEFALDCVGGTEIEHPNVGGLAYAMDAPHPLFEPNWVPGQVVVDHQVTELKVDALPRGLGGDADLRLGPEPVLDLLASGGRVTAMDGAYRKTPVHEVAFEVSEGVAVLSEDEELRSAVIQLGHFGPGQAVAQSCQFALFARSHRGLSLGSQPPEFDDLGA